MGNNNNKAKKAADAIKNGDELPNPEGIPTNGKDTKTVKVNNKVVKPLSAVERVTVSKAITSRDLGAFQKEKDQKVLVEKSKKKSGN